MNVFLSLFLLASPVPSLADEARCYQFSIPSPAREAFAAPQRERWCYRQVSGGTYVFNADSAVVRPELAVLKTNTGRLQLGSLGGGVVRYHSLPFRSFDVFSVPLEEPRGRVSSAPPVTAVFSASEDAVLRELERARPDALSDADPTAAFASYLPWRGYWWPLKGMPILGPLGKYDAFAGSRGRAGGAVDWERGHHVSHGIWWEGHCNGWAAAAILRAEPRSLRVDDTSGQSFSVSELKGIATEADYCAPSAFFGYRTRNSSGVSPGDFHRALVHYIGGMHKPIAFNIDNNGVVDNRVISGYVTDVRPAGNGYVVQTTLTYHEYDGSRSDVPGVAPKKTISYAYTLDANMSGGQWTSARRPGFVWVPLSTGGSCSAGNTGVKNDVVVDILGR